MVFSSVPIYLDPPNWQQQQPAGVGSENPKLPPPPRPPIVGGSGGGGPGPRPGSMADRARLAKIPQPEAALKCPRCESANTKFCYFNNYSLSQPRHFCKTCRRYWTSGGALRNVPVGGGCRRNKRSKSSRSKSPVTAQRQAGTSSTSTVSSNCCATDILSHLPPPPSSQLPFLPPLHHLSDYATGVIGLNFGGFQPPVVATGGGSGGGDVEFQIGTSSSGGGSVLSTGLAEQWRLQQVQQFPFLANLEQPIGLFQFEGENVEPPSYVGIAGQLRSKPLDSAVTGVSRQPATVKMEENQGFSLSRNILGTAGNDQYWGGGSTAWTDLFGFTSSSTSHML